VTTATNYFASCALKTGLFLTKTVLSAIKISKLEGHHGLLKKLSIALEFNVVFAQRWLGSQKSKNTSLSAEK
jgi:hypothetical protein